MLTIESGTLMILIVDIMGCKTTHAANVSNIFAVENATTARYFATPVREIIAIHVILILRCAIFVRWAYARNVEKILNVLVVNS